jgi:hypothetical protein
MLNYNYNHPAWIIQEKSFNTVHNDHSSHICCNESGIYVVYHTEEISNLNVTVFHLNTKGEYVWKKTMSTPLYNSNSITTICCDNLHIFISYQFTNDTVILYKININNPDDISFLVIKNTCTFEVQPSICCDTLYLYMTYYYEKNIYVRKISTDTLTEQWLPPFTMQISTDSDCHRSYVCKNSRGIYVTYMTEKNDMTEINIFKIVRGGLQWIDVQPAFSSCDKNINPSICCNVTDIYITYYDVQYNVYILKYDLDGKLLWSVKQENQNNNVYNLDPIICCNNDHVFFSYYTNGNTSQEISSSGSDIVVFKINTDGNDIVACQFLNFNTKDNDIEPSICSDKDGVYITYSTFGSIASTKKETTAVESDIVVFKLNADSFKREIANMPIVKLLMYKRINKTYH